MIDNVSKLQFVACEQPSSSVNRESALMPLQSKLAYKDNVRRGCQKAALHRIPVEYLLCLVWFIFRRNVRLLLFFIGQVTGCAGRGGAVGRRPPPRYESSEDWEFRLWHCAPSAAQSRGACCRGRPFAHCVPYNFKRQKLYVVRTTTRIYHLKQ